MMIRWKNCSSLADDIKNNSFIEVKHISKYSALHEESHNIVEIHFF